jgi:hypothetical protein
MTAVMAVDADRSTIRLRWWVSIGALAGLSVAVTAVRVSRAGVALRASTWGRFPSSLVAILS